MAVVVVDTAHVSQLGTATSHQKTSELVHRVVAEGIPDEVELLRAANYSRVKTLRFISL